MEHLNRRPWKSQHTNFKLAEYHACIYQIYQNLKAYLHYQSVPQLSFKPTWIALPSIHDCLPVSWYPWARVQAHRFSSPAPRSWTRSASTRSPCVGPRLFVGGGYAWHSRCCEPCAPARARVVGGAQAVAFVHELRASYLSNQEVVLIWAGRARGGEYDDQKSW